MQGGLDAELRIDCARQLGELDFAGYAVGGLSVGEETHQMLRMLEVTVPELPADRPRYLMGVGRPQDLLEGIARGIDLFDCVMPTRNGRNAMAFSDEGSLRLRNLQFERDERPLQSDCRCVACRRSRGYIAAPVHGQGDARARAANDPQSHLLPAAAGRRPAGDRGGSVCGIPAGETEGVGANGDWGLRGSDE